MNLPGCGQREKKEDLRGLTSFLQRTGLFSAFPHPSSSSSSFCTWPLDLLPAGAPELPVSPEERREFGGGANAATTVSSSRNMRATQRTWALWPGPPVGSR